MRYPAVAGQFYAGDAESLKKQVEECFMSHIGPGEVPSLNEKGARTIKGIVSPHAGFMFSGPVAAHGFKALAEDGFPDVFIIIGPNHTGQGSGTGNKRRSRSEPGQFAVHETKNPMAQGGLHRPCPHC